MQEPNKYATPWVKRLLTALEPPNPLAVPIVGNIATVEDGADVNFQGGAPIFLAIANRNRAIIEFLLDQGADAESFLSKKKLEQIEDRSDLIEELIACAPYNTRDVKPACEE